MAERHLIVNADDLGYSPAVNEGIFAAHEGGIVTSTSLMVLREAAPAAVEALPEHPNLAVGLHLEAEEEIQQQLDLFRQMTGREPTRSAVTPPPVPFPSLPTTPSAESSWRRFAIQM